MSWPLWAICPFFVLRPIHLAELPMMRHWELFERMMRWVGRWMDGWKQIYQVLLTNSMPTTHANTQHPETHTQFTVTHTGTTRAVPVQQL